MTLLSKTYSICNTCYRHIDAEKHIIEDKIYLIKTCPTHGTTKNLVEHNADFYLNYKYKQRPPVNYFLEITNRCNLSCPHCYQMPDNLSHDPSISSIISKVKNWPDNGTAFSLVGAEPTMRKDFFELLQELRLLPGKERPIFVLTNGVILSNKNFVKQLSNIKNLHCVIGLNHETYQGKKVRAKQIKGIENCVENSVSIKNISYTLEKLEHMQDCIEEIVNFKFNIKAFYRIRCGAQIGRSPKNEKQLYLSDLVTHAKEISYKKNISFTENNESHNRAHYAAYLNDLSFKIIQWPDKTTLDLKEVQTEALGDFLENKPISPLVHQVILRDAYVNKNLPLLDTIPDDWNKNYGTYND